MNNQEKLKEMISKLAENCISNNDAILAYLASIATSLAVIADHMEEESKNEKTNFYDGIITEINSDIETQKRLSINPSARTFISGEMHAVRIIEKLKGESEA